MSWYCPTETYIANPLQTPYPCCVSGPAPAFHTTYPTQQDCQDNTSCCNNANQAGTGNLDACCGGLDQGDPCTYNSWVSLPQAQRDAICQYCATSTASNDPCISEVSLYCRCCDGCGPVGKTTTTSTTEQIKRGVRRCPQFGPQLEFLVESWATTLYAIVWSYPIGTILELTIVQGEGVLLKACWEIMQFTQGIPLPAAVNGTLTNPTPVTCEKCSIPPPVEICTTTTTYKPRPAPYWCVEKCCDGTIHKIDATFPWDWSATLAGMTVGDGFLAQSFNNLNGTGLQECYRVAGPTISCGDNAILDLAPPTIMFPSNVAPCEVCLQQYECNQVGDVYQWFPPALPPPTGAAVDTGVNSDLCSCTTTTTTSMVTTTTTSCIFGCTDSTSCNYDPLATCNDGSCIAAVYGCPDGGNCIGTNCPGGNCSNPTYYYQSPYPGCPAFNYYPGTSIDSGMCCGWCNCLDPSGANYNFTGEIGPPAACVGAFTNGIYVDCAGNLQMTAAIWNGNVGDTSCCGLIVTTTTTVCIWGCTDSTATNYDPLATCNDGSCIPIVYGCMDDGCCTTGIGPDPLVGDPCVGGNTGLYHLCPLGGPTQPSYNSPTGPPGAVNFNPAVNLDNSSCIYPPLTVSFFETSYPPCVAFFGTLCCVATYDINIQMPNGLPVPQGDIRFEFEGYTTNPGVYYNAPLAAVYTHNTVSTSLDFDDEAYTTCSMALSSAASPWIAGLSSAIDVEGAVPMRVNIYLTTPGGIVFTGQAVLQDLATGTNISVGYNNNWDGTNTQTCDQSASSPGPGIGSCV
tara:strand:+ start:11241 stop:13622 length:2382 start_codon:yes stop_codon:yes gene_type:complete